MSRTLAGLAGLLAALATSCAPAPAPPTPDAAAGARLLLEQRAAEWNRGDLDGFLAAYARSESLSVYLGGESVRGWDAARDRYRRRFRTEGREMGRLDLEFHEVRALDAQEVVARLAWTLTRRRVKTRGVETLLVRHTDDGWRIVHDHVSPAP